MNSATNNIAAVKTIENAETLNVIDKTTHVVKHNKGTNKLRS